MGVIPKYKNKKVPSYINRSVSYDQLKSSYKYQQYRARFLELNPICRPCQASGIIHPSECIDHVIPHSKGGSFFDSRNHDPACNKYNNDKGDNIYEESMPGIGGLIPIKARINNV